jgi:myo-inositol catabolism protein IolC
MGSQEDLDQECEQALAFSRLSQEDDQRSSLGLMIDAHLGHEGLAAFLLTNHWIGQLL